MKKISVLVMLSMFMLAITPAMAQTRKDKKEAQKAAWKQKQQQAAEEAALLHEMRMDSIRNAKKAAEEAAQREEVERRQAEAEAKAKAKAAEEARLLQEQEYSEPCSEFRSAANIIYARGIGEDLEHQMSYDIARSEALADLGSQITTKVQALLMNYKKSVRQNLKRESLRRVEGLTMTEVDQTTGYRVACHKTTTYVQNGERIFKTYMVIELGEDQLLKPIYDGIQKDEELKIDADYQSFKSEFDQHFKDKSQESVEALLQDVQ